MGPVTKVLLLLALVVPVTAYVAGSLASSGSPAPTDHSPVILRDGSSDADEPTPDTTRGTDRQRDRTRGDRSGTTPSPASTTRPTPTAPSTPPTPSRPSTPPAPSPTPTRDGDRESGGSQRDDGDKARVVTPQPTPVGEDDDDEWDDDGPDDDETDTDDGGDGDDEDD